MLHVLDHLDGAWSVWECEAEFSDGSVQRGCVEGDGHECAKDTFAPEGTDDEPSDGFLSDAEADGDALASAGMGVDEDYGYYGGDD